LFNKSTEGTWKNDVLTFLTILSKGLGLSGAVMINGHLAASCYGIMGGIEFDLSKINKYQFDGFIGSKSDATCSPKTKFAMGAVPLEGIGLNSIYAAKGGRWRA
jgi:hypothetical protein